MNKKKISKKRDFALADIPRINIDETKLKEIKPEEHFKNTKKIAEVLFQCLIENDTEAFIEILDAYLRVNRTRVAQEAKMSRSTVKLALSKKGNPTLKTIASIVHATMHRP